MRYTKIFAFVAAGILALSLCACGSSYDDESIDDTSAVEEVPEQRAEAIGDTFGYIPETFISIDDSSLIGEWEITDMPLDELDPRLYADNTIVIKKDGTYLCGKATAKLSDFWYRPGYKEKKSYTEGIDYDFESLEEYGESNCTFFAIVFDDDGSTYPFHTFLTAKWLDEKHTEAYFDIMSTTYGSTVRVKKK